LTWSGDGKHLAAGYRDGTVQVWQSATGKRLAACPAPIPMALASGPLAIAFAPPGRVVAAVPHEQSVCVWEVLGGKRLGLDTGHTTAVLAVAFAALDSKTLVSADKGNAHFWDLTTGKQTRVVGLRKGPLVGLAGAVLSPNGRYLYGNHSIGPCLLETATGKELLTLPTPKRPHESQGTFSSDSTHLAVAVGGGRGRAPGGTWCMWWS
jgi:WD40 repeat protein